ncbi:hypothetical protein [Egicoccus halophilus]|uniref:PH domain-containing protein n=1 Tax=Egicoccus halophilus TaxID=1670830 RepID=A0A8J3EVG7_9ACTN|nr:hypothetical protein [Egicoccus halophilus]GGI09680.1 hypothetical protein GCM10011354_35280 [Egicoccus halophilus]
MRGSWIGRALLLVPVLLAGVGAGMVVAVVSGDPAAGGGLAGVVSLLGALRALRTGARIEPTRDRVCVRTFWRTHRVPLDALERVDADGRTESGTPAVRFLLRDGREYGSLALAYLAEQAAKGLAADLRQALDGRPVEVVLPATALRRAG